MDSLLPMLNAIDSFLWGVPLITLLVGTGILLTVRLALIQVVHLPRALGLILRAKNKGCTCRDDWHGQHRRRCDGGEGRRPRRNLLDVDGGVLRHGDEVRRGAARGEVPHDG